MERGAQPDIRFSAPLAPRTAGPCAPILPQGPVTFVSAHPLSETLRENGSARAKARLGVTLRLLSDERANQGGST